MINLSPGQISVLQNLCSVGQKVGMRLFLVGGVVRDLLLFNRLDDNDFDLVVEDGAACARELANQYGGKVKEFKDFLTAKVVNLGPSFGSIEVDFATARTEYYAKPGSLPTVQPASIDDDLRRRDFSINAMALPLESFVSGLGVGISKETLAKNLIDQFGGLDDLRAGQIKTLHDLSMIDDPTRAFRACRYAARIGGSIESGTANRPSLIFAK
jgi:tRNA nucleotidyltransferase (CCA-adding enzyme)